MIFLRQNTHALLVVLLFFLSLVLFFLLRFLLVRSFFFSLPYHRQSFVKEARSWKIIFNRRQTRFSKETTKIDLISKQRRNNKHKETCLSTHLIRYLDFILLSLSPILQTISSFPSTSVRFFSSSSSFIHCD